MSSTRLSTRKLATVLAAGVTAALACTATAAALSALWPTQPAASSTSLGPVLALAQQHGVLKVAMRTYSRPSLPGEVLPPEPDVLDQALASWLSQQLGVPVQLANASAADLVLQGADGGAHFAKASTPSYADERLQLVALKQQAARWQSFAPHRLRDALPAFFAQTPRSAPSVCVGAGLVSEAALVVRGLRAQIAPSSIHAISDFLAGKCDLLVETSAAMDRLLSQSSWRFYARLGSSFVADESAGIQLRADDAQSSQWLQQALQQWHASGLQQQALNNRVSTIALEASQLEDGAICH